MSSPEEKEVRERSFPKPGGPPKAGLVVAAIVGVVAILILIGTLNPGGKPPQTANAPSAPVVNGPPPAQNAPGPNTPSTNAPRSGAANTPAPANGPQTQVNPDDLPPDHPPIVTDEKSQVSIQWFGHSCFYLFSPGGVAVVTDPFDPKATGLAKPGTGAHLVTVSTRSPEHNFPEAVHAFQGDTKQVVHGTEVRRGDTHIIPIPTRGDRSDTGANVAYVVEAGPMRVAHLGDIGGILTPQQVQAFGPIDILLVPVGGDGLSPKQAVEVCKQLNPRLVIPMAYSALGMEGPAAKLRPVDDFIAASPFAHTAKDADIMMISRPDLPASTEVYTLRYGH
jgi:L-ascorbate metabolism protein UlaG (beta-lactamase superfamily)